MNFFDFLCQRIDFNSRFFNWFFWKFFVNDSIFDVLTIDNFQLVFVLFSKKYLNVFDRDKIIRAFFVFDVDANHKMILCFNVFCDIKIRNYKNKYELRNICSKIVVDQSYFYKTKLHFLIFSNEYKHRFTSIEIVVDKCRRDDEKQQFDFYKVIVDVKM